jgi:Protein of unknown function (DUF2384)
MSDGPAAAAAMKEKDSAEALRCEILQELPNAEEWLKSPHSFLGGQSPEEKIAAGDLESVRNLLNSILYIGVL